MAPPNDSIFDLGDKFGISSPFGDWLEKQAPEIQRPRGRQSASPKKYEDLLRQYPSQVPQDESKGSMLVLSDVVDPQNGVPGSAHFTIQMTYRLITSGEGEVHIRDQISPDKFAAIFSKGDIPGKGLGKPQYLQYASLPTPEIPGVLLTPEQILLSKKKDNQGQPRFWKYYNVSVTYKFKLEKIEGFNLVAGIAWMMEEVEARGILFNLLFESELKELRRMYKMSLLEYERELSAQDRNELDSTGEDYIQDLESLFTSELSRLVDILVGKDALLVAKQSIQNNAAIFQKKAVYIGKVEDEKGAWRAYYSPTIEELFVSDPEFLALLTNLDATFSPVLPENIGDEASAIIPKFDSVCEKLELIRPFNQEFYNYYIEKGETDENVGAIGYNEGRTNTRINFVVLNPVYFGIEASKAAFSYNELDIEEVFAHEAAHNSALDFKHTVDGTGEYEYHQKGLQSNTHRRVFPTRKNTHIIINDYLNRKYMQIQ